MSKEDKVESMRDIDFDLKGLTTNQNIKGVLLTEVDIDKNLNFQQ